MKPENYKRLRNRMIGRACRYAQSKLSTLARNPSFGHYSEVECAMHALEEVLTQEYPPDQDGYYKHKAYLKGKWP